MKYIDADKLIEILEEIKQAEYENCGGVNAKTGALQEVQELIESLQQEQPMIQNGKFVFPKYLYARTKDNKTIDMSYAPQDMTAIEYIRNDFVEQEQSGVDLEKFTEKIKTFQGRYKHPEIVSIKGAMAFMARMFYQYPNVARQWYEQLPKATMD